MKRVLKAYKCVFPKLYDDYNIYMWQDNKQFEVIFGETQRKAVTKRCSNDEFCSYWELKQSIQTRRYPELDLYSQEKSKLLDELTDKQIGHLTHSLGVQIGDIYKKDFYRNYSLYYEKHEDCEFLVKLGLMENWQKLGSEVYAVTPKGIEAVKTLLLINKS